MIETTRRLILKAIHEVETALVQQNYRAIGKESRPSEVTALEIQDAIQSYGGNVTFIPEGLIEQLEVIRIGQSDPPQWAVDLRLFIDYEPSDLVLSLTIVSTDSGDLLALVDDLHVE